MPDCRTPTLWEADLIVAIRPLRFERRMFHLYGVLRGRHRLLPKLPPKGRGPNPIKAHAPRPSLAPTGSDRSIHTWRSGISKASPPAGAPKPAFTSMPPLLAEELDIQSRRTAAVPAPCHVTIFPPGPQKAHATKLAPPKIVMRTSTGQTAGPVTSSSHGAGAGHVTGFPPFPPFPAFPAFPSFPPFPAFPAWPTYPAPQAHGR